MWALGGIFGQVILSRAFEVVTVDKDRARERECVTHLLGSALLLIQVSSNMFSSFGNTSAQMSFATEAAEDAEIEAVARDEVYVGEDDGDDDEDVRRSSTES